MAKQIFIPLYMELNGVFYRFFRMLHDFEYYNEATGRSNTQWQKWRARQMKKYCLDEDELNDLYRENECR